MPARPRCGPETEASSGEGLGARRFIGVVLSSAPGHAASERLQDTMAHASIRLQDQPLLSHDHVSSALRLLPACRLGSQLPSAWQLLVSHLVDFGRKGLPLGAPSLSPLLIAPSALFLCAGRSLPNGDCELCDAIVRFALECEVEAMSSSPPAEGALMVRLLRSESVLGRVAEIAWTCLGNIVLAESRSSARSRVVRYWGFSMGVQSCIDLLHLGVPGVCCTSMVAWCVPCWLKSWFVFAHRAWEVVLLAPPFMAIDGMRSQRHRGRCRKFKLGSSSDFAALAGVPRTICVWARGSGQQISLVCCGNLAGRPCAARSRIGKSALVFAPRCMLRVCIVTLVCADGLCDCWRLRYRCRCHGRGILLVFVSVALGVAEASFLGALSGECGIYLPAPRLPSRWDTMRTLG